MSEVLNYYCTRLQHCKIWNDPPFSLQVNHYYTCVQHCSIKGLPLRGMIPSFCEQKMKWSIAEASQCNVCGAHPSVRFSQYFSSFDDLFDSVCLYTCDVHGMWTFDVRSFLTLTHKLMFSASSLTLKLILATFSFRAKDDIRSFLFGTHKHV